MPGIKVRGREVYVYREKVSHKAEMLGPLNRGDTIINKHFTFTFYFRTIQKSYASKSNPSKFMNGSQELSMNLEYIWRRNNEWTSFYVNNLPVAFAAAA